MIEVYLLPDADDSQGLGVPYQPAEASQGPMEYYDLKRNPADIDKMDWLADYPSCREFLATINAGDSFFRTVRCEIPCPCDKGPEGAKQRLHWNVTLAVEVLELNTPQNYQKLVRLFSEEVSSKSSDLYVAFEFTQIPTCFLDHEYVGISFDAEIYGLAGTVDASREAFDYGLKLLQNFFVGYNKYLPKFESDGNRMIS